MLVAGLVILLAAICGGGLKAAGVEFPLLYSVKRQVALGVLGAVLIGLSFIQELAMQESGVERIPGNVAETAAPPAQSLRTTEIQTQGKCSPAIKNSTLRNISIKCPD